MLFPCMLFPCMHLNPPKQHPSSDPNHVYLKGCTQVIQAFPNSVYERYTVFPTDDEQSLSYTLVQPVGYTTAQCCPLSVMLLELHSENPRSQPHLPPHRTLRNTASPCHPTRRASLFFFCPRA